MSTLKVAIIGSGSTYTPELIEGLINRKDTMPVRELALMDIDKRKLEIVGDLAKRMVSHAGLDCNAYLTEDYDTALKDADFVFVQIRVGKLPARVLDEKIPLKHELIGQETTGIGGFFKALRTIPVLLDIAKRMERLCPNAWMINFSNPSGICAQALLDHGNIKVMGLCNAPFGIISGPVNQFTQGEAEVDYVGLNHLSFLTSVRADGKDYLQEALNGNDEYLNKLDWQMGFSKDIIKRVGGVPNYYLHYFTNQRNELKKLKAAKQSRGEVCMEIEEELLAMYSDTGLYVKPEQLSKRGGAMYSEAACSLAESLYTGNGSVHVVNTYNNGQIPYMADDDVVEIRASVDKDGPKVLPVKEPGGLYIKGLLTAVKAYERLTVKAAVEGCKDSAIAALMVNPLIADHDAALACFDEMLEAHRAFLGQFK